MTTIDALADWLRSSQGIDPPFMTQEERDRL